MADFRDIAESLIGRIVWGARPGFATMLTLEIDESVPAERHPGRHGSWHLWVYGSSWRVQNANSILVASGDDENLREHVGSYLDGKTIISVRQLSFAFDMEFQLSDNLTLTLFSNHSRDIVHWHLYLPNNQVFSAGPGVDYFLGRSDSR